MFAPVLQLLLLAGGAVAAIALLRPMAQRQPETSPTPRKPRSIEPPSIPAPPGEPSVRSTPDSPVIPRTRVTAPPPAADGAGQKSPRGWGHGSSAAPPTPPNLPHPAPASRGDWKDRSLRPRVQPPLTALAASSPAVAASEPQEPAGPLGESHESEGWIELEAGASPNTSASLGEQPLLQAPNPPPQGPSASPP